MAFAPDGQTLATVDHYDVLRLWNWKSGRELRHFKDVGGPVSFSPDGKSIAAAGMDNRIRIWSTETGWDLCPFVDPGRIDNAAFSPDGRVLAAGSDRGPTRLFDANSGRELRQFSGYRLIAFSPKGGQLLVRRQEDGRLGLWCLLDVATGRERVRFGDGEEGYFGGWDADKKLVLTCGGSSVRVWDTATGKLRREIRGKEKEGEIYCSPDGRTVVVGNRQEDRIRLLASDSGEEVRQLTGYKWDVRSDAQRGGATVSGGDLFRPLFSANGKVLLAGCGSEALGLWDVSTGKQFLRLNCGQFLPHKPIFSPNGDLLSLLDSQGDPCLVDAATGRVRHRLSWKGGDLGWILKSVRAFSADGRMLAAAYDPHTIVLWEVATGRPIHTWPGHGRGELRQMTFSADSRRLATVGTDGTVLVWDVSR
ncbi:MAG TPA: WD40 repeat domain-containing protein [Gemmataceae bacterium]